ncbi:MAG: NAD(+) synthase, partial [Anaerolineales bacterium]|nr:NAD(+) synthase [Anaerolineales bacterium]
RRTLALPKDTPAVLGWCVLREAREAVGQNSQRIAYQSDVPKFNLTIPKQRAEDKMDRIGNHLEIEPETICLQIEKLLSLKLRELGKQGIVIGISGGFDSAIVAYVSGKAIGHDKVRLLYLPDRDSKAIHRQHAQLIANELGIALEVRDITSILDEMGIYELLPISALPGQLIREVAARFGKTLLGLGSGSSILEARFHPEPNSLVAKANAYAMSKHRLRMLLLYQQAEIFNLMVVGAANRTELMTGTFSQWGCDQCADVMPLIHLYRSQLYPLASYLHLPKTIVEKPADPDFIPGLDDKEELLGSFVEADRILIGLEKGVGREELIQSYGAEAVDQIVSLVELSRPMRESPYVIEMDIQDPSIH